MLVFANDRLLVAEMLFVRPDGFVTRISEVCHGSLSMLTSETMS